MKCLRTCRGDSQSTEAADEIAANFLIRKVREFPGEVTIIAMGPLTNLALAQRLEPEFAKLAKQLIYMGGSLNPQKSLDSVAAEQFSREFVHTPRREFNIRFDPEAAAIASARTLAQDHHGARGPLNRHRADARAARTYLGGRHTHR